MNCRKKEYGDCVREVEQASFTPFMFATTGDMGREAVVFYRRLADHLSHRTSTSYSRTLDWIRCTLSFSLFSNNVHTWKSVHLHHSSVASL